MKIIGLDLDGTLLNSYREISPEQIDYLKKIKNENLLILSSGRPYTTMKKYYEQLGLDTPIICNGGGYVFNPLSQLFPPYMSLIKEEDIKLLFKKNKKIINHAMFNLNNYAYVYNRTFKTDFLLNLTKETIVVEGEFTKTVTSAIINCTFIIYPEFKSNFLTFINEHFEYIKYRILGEDKNNCIIEIFNKSTDKAYAMEYLIKYYKLSWDDCIVFGDGPNDALILQKAKYGVAMGNSYPDIKECGSYVTDKNDDNGIMSFLEKYFNGQIKEKEIDPNSLIK